MTEHGLGRVAIPCGGAFRGDVWIATWTGSVTVLMRRLLLLSLITAAALTVDAVLGAYAGAAVPAWTTYRHDGARSGIDPDSTSPVTPSQAWQTPALDGEVYGQPLVYGAYVYVATENDSVYKLDAATGAVRVVDAPRRRRSPRRWRRAATSRPRSGSRARRCIDPATNRIYAVGAVSDSARSITNCSRSIWARGSRSRASRSWSTRRSRAAALRSGSFNAVGLALDGGRILIGYGGNDGDCSTYWGWLVSAPDRRNDRAQLVPGRPPGHAEGAIWGGGNAPPVDGAGNVYVATGNGSGDSTSDPDYGDSVVKLNASASPLDWWAPPNWQSLDSSDLDLGSSLPTLLPGASVRVRQGRQRLPAERRRPRPRQLAGRRGVRASARAGASAGRSTTRPTRRSTPRAAAASEPCRSATGSPPSLAAKAGFSAPSGATGPPMIAGGLVWATNSLERAPCTGSIRPRGRRGASFSIPETRVRRQPLRQPERRRRTAVRRQRRPGDRVHDRPAAARLFDGDDAGLVGESRRQREAPCR